MRKTLLFLSILVITLGLFGCSRRDYDLYLSFEDMTKLNLGDVLELEKMSEEDHVWESSDITIITVTDYLATAVGKGLAQLSTIVDEVTYVITVYADIWLETLTIQGNRNLIIGETAQFSVTIVPTQMNQAVIWSSSDTDVLQIDSSGLVIAEGFGMATIYATSIFDATRYASTTVIVQEHFNEYTLEEENTMNITESLIELDLTSLQGMLEPVINKAKHSVVGISNYEDRSGALYLNGVASGIVYKRTPVFVEDEESSDQKFKTFEYYVITNRHVVASSDVLKIYYHPDKPEISATLIQFDDKVDLAVMRFESKLYFPTAVFGNSDEIQTGEFIITIGHAMGYQYHHSSTLGVISYPARYLSDDTDGDGTNDWDALYIQHDAPINEGNSGGPVINLKGEVIGINTLKISSVLVENLGFAIPMNLVTEIAELLEQGIKPQRATLGVMVIDVRAVLANPFLFPDYIIPSGLTFGFYVTEVNNTGIAHAAGVQPHDIIVRYNHIEMRYSYILRAEIGKFLIGSGDIVEMEVYRNGVLVTLIVTY